MRLTSFVDVPSSNGFTLDAALADDTVQNELLRLEPVQGVNRRDGGRIALEGPEAHV